MKADLIINTVLILDTVLLVLAVVLRKIKILQAFAFVGAGLLAPVVGITLMIIMAKAEGNGAIFGGLALTYLITILTFIVIGIILLIYIIGGKTLPPKTKKNKNVEILDP